MYYENGLFSLLKKIGISSSVPALQTIAKEKAQQDAIKRQAIIIEQEKKDLAIRMEKARQQFKELGLKAPTGMKLFIVHDKNAIKPPIIKPSYSSFSGSSGDIVELQKIEAEIEKKEKDRKEAIRKANINSQMTKELEEAIKKQKERREKIPEKPRMELDELIKKMKSQDLSFSETDLGKIKAPNLPSHLSSQLNKIRTKYR